MLTIFFLFKTTSLFQGLLKIMDFSSVALVIKKLLDILDFFYTLKTFYRPVPYPLSKKKNVQKNP